MYTIAVILLIAWLLGIVEWRLVMWNKTERDAKVDRAKGQVNFESCNAVGVSRSSRRSRLALSAAGYARLIAEIRARQRQATILLFTAFPRGRLGHEQWRDAPEANAAAVYRARADEKTVFCYPVQDRSQGVESKVERCPSG